MCVCVSERACVHACACAYGIYVAGCVCACLCVREKERNVLVSSPVKHKVSPYGVLVNCHHKAY